MHGVDNSTIREDDIQNWQLLNGERSGDRTIVTIQRALDTCDDRDVAFNQSLILLVWDLGENHFIPTQLTVEGRAPVYFWDTREYSLDNVRDLQSWRITRNFRIPPRHTSYWCTIHKRNAFMSSKQHIVSMKAYFRDDVSMKFIHHQLLYRCTAPPGIEPSTIFERFLNHPGEECYLKDDIQLPSTLCREVVHTYGVGGEGAILPYHMGLPVGETQNEYYMFESHYDNPEMRSDVEVEHGVDFQSTPNLRPLDSGIFFVGHGILGTFVMPPQTSSFEVVGQCSSKCTSKMLPPTGVEIHIVSLHAHLSARRMRLRHFRGNQELPWILTNDNYHFDLQKGRVLVEPVTILPGDHLVLHCDYDNTWKNGSVSTVAGFSTRDEMCTAFLTVNQRLPYTYCTSEYPVEDTMSRFGIRNMTWDLELHQRVVHSAVNPSIVGLTLPEVVGNFSNWSQAEKNELERRQIFSEHTAACPNVRVFGPLAYTGVKLQELTFNILQIPFLPQANPTRSLLVTPGTFFRTSVQVILLVVHLNPVSSQRFGVSGLNNRFTYKNRHREVLDSKTGYAVEWDVNRNSKSIVFNISTRAAGNGYVAFGLSKNGQLEGADVVLCGIDNTGRPYIYDTTGSGRNRLNRDSTQKWRVLSAQTTQGRMQMSISRDLDTCDDRDLIINNDLIHVIWGQGNGTSFQSQFVPQGNMPIYLFDPESSPNSSGLQNWRISRRFRVPPRHTSYWCSITKGPSLSTKHHISAFGAYLPNELARRHVHHQLVYRCTAPPGMDPVQLFEQFTNHPGEECYLNDNHVLPTVFCREIIHMWAVGGRPTQLPEEVGIPIGLGPNEYFLYETHYDNPDVRTDLEIESGVDFQYSPQIRRDEGMIIFNGYSVFGGFAVPPQSSDFQIAGHCSPECSRNMLSEVGSVDIIGVTLHAHISSRKLRLHHFRGNREMPWIMNDDNYDFNYQQIRYLPNPVTILPGDQLTTRCSYDTTWKNGSTVSGFSTRDEMCMSFLFINKRIPYIFCTSEYPTEQLMAMFGIRNMTWEVNSHERIITASDFPQHIGLKFSDVVNRVNWTPQQKTELEREQLYGNHSAACPNLNALAQMAVQVIIAQQAAAASGQTSGGPNPSNALSGLNTISTPGATSTASYPVQAVAYRAPTCQRLRSPWEIQTAQRNQVDLRRGNIGRYPYVPAPISGGFFSKPRHNHLFFYPSTNQRIRKGY
ncbi:unnamed protein product [Orchesella dallaii]|uniref:DOMON domain-containing protein n=1 Tax=Orchesella dallaii TaxID=48710 RepID=A0ABP1S2C5_9HEXA